MSMTNAEAVRPVIKGSYQKSSFFDTISCDALDRLEGVNGRLRAHEERKLNTETFGAVGLNNRRGYRGNRNNGNGNGGGNRNRNGGNGYPTDPRNYGTSNANANGGNGGGNGNGNGNGNRNRNRNNGGTGGNGRGQGRNQSNGGRQPMYQPRDQQA
ncbi:hypothetical protein SPRG_16721 [Saprolegnia parasitica CBS 223.65]|uniref:DFDF domain-containing protein n=1 Tax=Saprolegnia parasitica (strain CBS 223.65) TaxID=695850 RepID=A0A067BI79_SAPPC|nr:hypothetical protein SPRG_16721 [Saprolegnia parasitica CBS 223.65]KDO17863.1 hypothetical protein SPRG_16721 [Saprolegnia parasitica CBS 223.65]|eukprot:XP_012211426.1 hypothetical protein SPRG_16721 [Saprolegnia parasitica CBS 223.65]